MRHEAWTSIKPDGTIDEAELARPAQTTEPTVWQVTIPLFGNGGGRQTMAVHLLHDTARRCPRHRFWALTSQLKTLPEIGWPENVTLAVGPLKTQAEVDEAIPALLEVEVARREVVLAPTEPIDVSDYLDCGYESGGPQGWIDLPSLDAVRVRGGEMQHVNLLRAQCKRVGVEFVEEP